MSRLNPLEQKYNVSSLRHLEHADASRLSTYLKKNLESRFILRAPLLINELKNQVHND